MKKIVVQGKEKEEKVSELCLTCAQTEKNPLQFKLQLQLQLQQKCKIPFSFA